MKTRNIIAILSIICTMIMTSCSADSVLDEMGNQNIPASSEAVALTFNANMSAATRATGTEAPVAGKEDAVSNPVFFLVKGTSVLGAADAGEYVYTKSQSDIKVIAIACASEALRNELKVMTNTDAIYNKVLGETELNSFIKIGEQTVDFSKAINGKVTENVTVNQVAARIDIASLKINKNHADNVLLKSATLINRQLKGKLQGNVSGADESYGDAATAVEINKAEVNTDTTIGYTFANGANASKKVTLKLVFDVDGEDVPVLVSIKHDGTERVEAGFIYKLKLTATITGKNVVPVIDFQVAKWNKTSISADMEEI